MSDTNAEVEELRKQLAVQEEKLLDMRIRLKQHTAQQRASTGACPGMLLNITMYLSVFQMILHVAIGVILALDGITYIG